MLQPGMVIGERYEIVDTVGAGGMSVVYRAKDYRLNRFVAMKVLKDEYSNDKTFVNKFRIEAQSAAGLSHPNIVNVFDVGDDNGIHYIVMELIEGITLKEYIGQKGKLSVSEAVNFSIQIAAGLEVAHDNHIVHRDIKPQNIIVSPQGVLKVTDFGIARAASSATVSANSAIGSVHYISPEQARGGYSDEKSDIYSLGITMYEMITGRVPFEGENNVAVALAHIQNEMIAPHEYYPDILPSMELVIAKCTQKKPECRYLTANALIADLRRVEADPSGSFVHIMSTIPNNATTVIMPEKDLQTIRDSVAQTDNRNIQPFKVETPAESMREEEEEPVDEGDDEEQMNPKLEKLVVIVGIIAAVLVLALVIFLIAKFAGGSSKKKTTTTQEATTQAQTVSVPDVKGDTLTDAVKALEEVGLDYETEEVESDEEDAGKVLSQIPAADEMAQVGSKVKLTVVKTEEGITVPDVQGLSSSAAEKSIGNNFTITYKYAYDDEVAEDDVISQSPAGNTTATKGSAITLTISRGKEVKEVAVPDLYNKSVESAEKALTKVGLVLGSTTQDYSDTVAKGKVMQQGYASGTKVDSGTAVNIVVSKGVDSSSISYVSETTVDVGTCFEAGVTSGRVKIVLTQDKYTKAIYDQTVTTADFPIILNNIQGVAEGSGQISIYVDGILKTTGSINFTPVKTTEADD